MGITMIIGYATTQPWYLALFCIIVAVVVALLYRHHLHDKHLHGTALTVQPELGEQEEDEEEDNDIEDEDCLGDADDLADADWEVSLSHESLRSAGRGCGSGRCSGRAGSLSQPGPAECDIDINKEAKGWLTGPQYSGGSVGSPPRSLEDDEQARADKDDKLSFKPSQAYSSSISLGLSDGEEILRVH